MKKKNVANFNVIKKIFSQYEHSGLTYCCFISQCNENASMNVKVMRIQFYYFEKSCLSNSNKILNNLLEKIQILKFLQKNVFRRL